jgi:RHS repeat-associated protein
VVAHHRYSAYGLDAVFGAGTDNRRFARGMDLGDGLVLLGARIHDQYTGRFLSQDPVFGELNQYAYTLGNPVQFWDPDGAQQAATEARARVVNAWIGFFQAVVGVFVSPFAIASVGPILGGMVVTGALANLFRAGVEVGMAISAANVAEISGPGGGGGGGGGGGDGGSGSGGPRGTGSKMVKQVTISIEGVGEDLTVESPATGSCAPSLVALSAPNLNWLLGILVPLQLALAGALLRQRRFQKG